jgi:serine/threonine protein kinase
MSFSIGENVGPYRIMEQLGQGGMATVYKAYHASLDRYVAIKVMHPAFLDDHTFKARFQREARMVAKLEHPNIVPIYDFSEHEGRPYLVMKFIEGETLKARMERGKLNNTEIARIVEVVGGALAYAHSQNILHRDIKPSNVLLGKDGNIYLADFGLARMAISGESSLTTDRLVGTPQYISPEQALSKPDLDARTDIYSFGVMVYEMVVGRVPFNADTPFAIIHDHIYTPLPLPRQVNPAVSEGVERVLLKALAKNPKDRFAEIKDFVIAFRQAIKASELPTAIVLPVTAEAAPSLEPAAQTEQAAPISVPGVTQVSPQPLPTPPAMMKKSFPWKTVILIGGVLVLVAFFSLLILGGMKKGKQESQLKTEQALTAEVTVTLSPLADDKVVEARRLLDQAIQAFQEQDLPRAQQSLQKMRDMLGENLEFYREAFSILMDKKAYLLAATMLPFDRLNLIYAGQAVEFTHQLVYLTAGDPLAKDFIDSHADDPLFAVAKIRKTLYFEDVAKAKENLGAFTKTVQARRFPETKLLEVEIFIQLKDFDQARLSLGELRKSNPPDWILVFAVELEQKYLNP